MFIAQSSAELISAKTRRRSTTSRSFGSPATHFGLALALTHNRLAHGLGLVLLTVWLFLGYWNYRIA